MVFSLIAVTPVVAVDIAGDGTSESPLQIGTAEQLLDFAARVTAAENGDEELCAVLTNNITVENWTTIGKRSDGSSVLEYRAESPTPYVGTFDGNGKTLSLTYIAENQTSNSNPDNVGVALFRTIGTDGVVKNLDLEVDFKGYYYLAGVAVYNYGTIDYVTVSGSISTGAASNYYIAGIASYNGYKTVNEVSVPGRILHCVNKAELSRVNTATSGILAGKEKIGADSAAGICANFLGEMRYCVNLGTIWSTNGAASLFVLRPAFKNNDPVQPLIVSDCYNAGTIYVVTTTNSRLTSYQGGGLLGADTSAVAMVPWAMDDHVKISDVFNYGLMLNPYPDETPKNVSDDYSIIGFGANANITESFITAVFSNIYYRPEIGGKLFNLSEANGAPTNTGTSRVQVLVHSTNVEDFATAALATALNNGRTGASAPWEFVENNAYPTLKFERADYDPNDDIYTPEPPEPDVIDVDYGYGGVITAVQDEDGQYAVSVTADNYVIDTISVDGVRLDNVQGLTTFTTTVTPTRSIFATFAYTVNFIDPANGTLSVSRESEYLTSGSIVRAGEILTVSYIGTDELILNGLERIDDTDQYKVVARRDAPPSISFEIGTPGPVVDKTALHAAIAGTTELVEIDYTPNSWSALQSALSAAQTIAAKADATAGDVTDATMALTEAINALVPRADKTALTGAIEAATAYTESDYTPELWQVLAEALTAAQSVLKDDNATPGAVADAVSAINNAITGLATPTLPEPVDKTALTGAIEAAMAYTESEYTPESWQALAEALTAAQSVLTDDNATPGAVADAVKAINDAIAGLVAQTSPEEPVDKTALNAAITAANALRQTADDYTAASWAAFANALTAAQGVLANADATQAEVDTAAANLTTAKNALVVRSVGGNSSNSSGNSSGAGTLTPPQPTPSATPAPQATPGETSSLKVVETVTVTAEIDPAATTVDESGKATTAVDSKAVTDALATAVKAVETAKADGETNAAAEIRLDVTTSAAQTTTVAEVDIPAAALKAVAETKEVALTVESDISVVTLDSAALNSIAAKTGNDETVKIVAETVDKAEALNARQLSAVGENPVIELSVTVGTTAITDLGGNVTVRVPYAPGAETARTDYDLLTVYYLDENGNISEMKGASYDASTGEITFTMTHFSKFFASEWISPFADIAKGDWFYKPARFAYSNELIVGTAADQFSPQTNLTRAMLVTILWRREGSPATAVTGAFDDVKAGQWYFGAIAWANANGIAVGEGDNRFAPDSDVTREQIATILYNYAKYKKLNTAETASFAAYSDADSVSDWAAEAIAWANAAGILTGVTPETLAPQSGATRAQAAALLQRFIENAV
jgi:hypothetical protein